MPEVPLKDWERITKFYRDLIDTHGWEAEPLADFVSWLASGPHGRSLFPSTSHDALGLATVATYHERLEHPMVYIQYVKNRGFIIDWQAWQGKTVREECVSSPQSPEVFERLLMWLNKPAD